MRAIIIHPNPDGTWWTDDDEFGNGATLVLRDPMAQEYATLGHLRGHCHNSKVCLLCIQEREIRDLREAEHNLSEQLAAAQELLAEGGVNGIPGGRHD